MQIPTFIEVNANYTYRKGKLSKWLLTIVLFFSSLSFSGYAGNAVAHGQEKTEAIPALAGKSHFHKRCITYKKAIAFAYREKAFANTVKNKRQALAEKRKRIKVRLDDNLKQSFSFTTLEHRAHLKIISRNSDEHPFSSLAG
jgi:hypothetical protein